LSLTWRRPLIRILIVEDDLDREKLLLSWLPPEVKAVVATSAGKAMGILRVDWRSVYAGIVLDHDLQARKASESDRYLSGQDVTQAIIEHIKRHVPILIHSMNASQRAVISSRLQRAGFEVTTMPMDALTPEPFRAWVDSVIENWRDLPDGSA
jgi:CheY-like chemotaxis protein